MPTIEQQSQPSQQKLPTTSVIESAQFFPELKIATEALPNPEYHQHFKDIRMLIQTIGENEELLMMCNSSGHSNFEIHMKLIPEIIRAAAEKKSLPLTEEKSRDYAFAFAAGDYRTINLYLEQTFGKENIFEALCVYSQRYFEHKYMRELVSKTQTLLKQFFPELYVDFPNKTQLLVLKENVKHNNASHTKDESGTHILELVTSADLSEHRSYEELETPGVFNQDTAETPYVFQRKMHDLLAMVHEYAHGIYDMLTPELSEAKKTEFETTPKEEKTPYYFTADAALNEGFAILIETLTTNKLLENAEELQLTERDREDLRHFKSLRFRSLLRTQKFARKKDTLQEVTAYPEGFIRLLAKLYRSSGTAGVKEYLTNINKDITLSMRRDSDTFRDLIELAQSPEAFFSRLASLRVSSE